MHPAVKVYAQEVRKYAGSDSTAEETYYPPLVTLLKSLLAERKLPSDVRANLRQQGSRPDLAFHAADGEVPLAGGEVKLPSADLDGIALGTGTNDQVGRYLALYGVVIVTNVRGFRLVAAKPNLPSGPVKPADRVLVGDPVTFWPSETAMASGEAPADRAVLLADLLEEALSHYAAIATPASLASILARMARRAKAAIPHDDADLAEFKTGFAEALGIHFTGEEGDEFFRSSIVQTAFYSLFAAWVLWVRDGGRGTFDVTQAQNVKLPFVGRLLYSLLNPSYEESHGMRSVLEEAARVLNRVDSAKFFDKFGGPKSTDLSAAITYFYEPFLEAFDPKLREDLGVWYTPPEIVRYQVAKVHGLLKTELGFAKGLAHPDVVVLDPCCGTGAYLLETVRVIAAELGDGDDVPGKVAEAVRDRLVGFEILAAPYVIAHLQLHLAIAKAPLPKGERPAVFLTNALTGWGEDQVKIHFPELRQEHDAARKAKRDGKVIVVIGNPPYNRFAGAPAAEERELADPYKGIRRDAKGKQVGKGKLYEEWGIRKSLLDDLYIRFFRLAEERIGARADRGIVSFISNSSYLAGRSHPIMRESLVKKFPRIWVDNLHGNRLASERTPWGTSCETAFKMTGTAGVKVGTAIVTMLVRPSLTGSEARTRDFFGTAEAKMKALGLPEGIDAVGEYRVSAEAQIPGYRLHTPTKAKRWKLVPYDAVGGYEDWPSLDELFPYGFQGVNANRGYDDSVIDIDRTRLERRMEEYFGPMPHDAFFAKHPILGENRASYDRESVRNSLRPTPPPQ